MEITKREIKAAFAEWQRRWLENPEEFKGYDDDALPEVYGKDAADYFVGTLLKDVRAKPNPSMQRSIKKGK